VTSADDQTVERITKQLNKQIRVLSVTDLTMLAHIEREMALIHIKTAVGNERQQVMHLVDIFRARVIDVSESALTIETTRNRSKVNALLGLLGPLGIHEMVRAGTLAIPRLPAATAGENVVRDSAAG
jgi:acetolactate synthase I/III small subunit